MYFPLMVNLQNKKICIIGGGEVAKKRGLVLKNYCNEITVIAPQICDELNFAKCKYEKYSKETIENADLVIICTDDKSLNVSIAQDCKDMGILYNLTSLGENSEVQFPSVVDIGELRLSISTNGKYPALVKKIKHELEEQYSKYDEKYMEELVKFRKIVLEYNLDKQLLYVALDLDIKELKSFIGKYR